MTSAAAVLAVAAREIGTVESPPGSNRQKYGEEYGMNGVAWCAEFVTYVARHAGIPESIVPKFAYCPAGASFFQRKKLWGTEPRPGAIVFFNLGGLGRLSHTGWCETFWRTDPVTGARYFHSIEGNTNGAGSRTGGEVRRQARRILGVGGGFGYPELSGPVAAPAPAAPQSAPAPAEDYSYGGRLIRLRDKAGNEIRPPMSGEDVKRLQRGLNRHAHNLNRAPLVEDGVWGEKSDAFLYAYQQARHGDPFHLDVDRIGGPGTFGSVGR